jgi:hypothetical protein
MAEPNDVDQLLDQMLKGKTPEPVNDFETLASRVY